MIIVFLDWNVLKSAPVKIASFSKMAYLQCLVAGMIIVFLPDWNVLKSAPVKIASFSKMAYLQCLVAGMIIVFLPRLECTEVSSS